MARASALVAHVRIAALVVRLAVLVGGVLVGFAACGDRPGPTLITSDVVPAPRAGDRSCVVTERGTPGPRTWRVQRGDTLTSIAVRTYGRADLGREIERANPGSVRGGQLTVGTVLVLPHDVR